MYKEILQTIVGIEVFPVLSLVLFVTVFGAVLIQVSRMSREQAGSLSELPFDDGRVAPPRRSGTGSAR